MCVFKYVRAGVFEWCACVRIYLGRLYDQVVLLRHMDQLSEVHDDRLGSLFVWLAERRLRGDDSSDRGGGQCAQYLVKNTAKVVLW